MGDELKWVLKQGVVRVVMFLSKISPSQMQLV